MGKGITAAIVGLGCRGMGYGRILAGPGNACKVAAIAEPRAHQRNGAAKEFGVPKENVFEDWRELAERSRLADAVIIATQDDMHTAPALAFLAKGYHVLLEKPMASTESECVAICNAAKASGSIFAVCHVLRYTPYFKTLRRLVEDGAAGEIASVRHIERVTYWHQAHSFVRGNWRSSKSAAPMIIAKACHDMDILLYLTGRRCKRVSSFGSLLHFRKERMPAESTGRCMSCPLADGKCPYSAKSIYLRDRAAKGQFGWPVDIISDELTIEGVERALREGPYGRCVYDCDNDAVDNQAVNMEFEGGASCSFVMTAFTPQGLSRETEIMGSRGYLHGDSNAIEAVDFATGKRSVYDISKTEGLLNDGHGGGDNGIIKDFVAAVEKGDQSMLSSGPEISLEGHLIGFAAERARLHGTVEKVPSPWLTQGK